MSSGPQMDSFNQINLNAIKNTKLFQKFMQNKSGLSLNNSALGKISEPKLQQQSYGNEKKWAVNRNNQNNEQKIIVNIKKQKAHLYDVKQEQISEKQQQQNQIQKVYTNYSQNEHQLKASSINRQYLSYQQLQQQSLVEPYNQRQLGKNMQGLQFEQRSQFPKGQNYISGIQQQVYNDRNSQGVSNPNKRKRNFNAYGQSARNQAPIQQSDAQNLSNLSLGNELIKQSRQSNQIQDKNNSSNSNNNNNNGRNYNKNNNDRKINSQTMGQQQKYNNFNYSRELQKEQKYVKVESSPGKSVNPMTYQMNQKAQHKCYQSTQSGNAPSNSISFSEMQYKQKYQTIQKKYEQLKQELKTESKNRKKQYNQWEHQIQMLKQKLFDVQSRQDSLLIENHRLKEKCESQNLLKMKTQQQNKQLTFRIKELEDQLSMRENAIKQRNDQTNYWKTQVDAIKQQLNMLRLGLEKKNDQYNLLFGDYQIVKKERDNKDYLLEDLRRNINTLVEENSAAKDEIFKIVTKLYHLEQENQVLRNDLKRQQLDSSQINNYMKDLQQQPININRERIHSTNLQRQPQQQQYEPHRMMERNLNNRNQSFIQQNQQPIHRNSLTQQEISNMEKPTRRRGQFARERGQLARNQRPQRDQRQLPVRQISHNMSNSQQRSFNQASNKPSMYANNNRVSRMQQIGQELQKIKDMKAMNGAIRRRKIDLERQLQELQGN